MGDMADWITQNELDWEARGENADGFPEPPLQISCKYCGEGPMQWVKAPTGWRLQTLSGSIHSCSSHPKYGFKI